MNRAPLLLVLPLVGAAVGACAGTAPAEAGASARAPATVQVPRYPKASTVKKGGQRLGPAQSGAAALHQRARPFGVALEPDNAWHAWAQPSEGEGPEPAVALPAPWDPHRGPLTASEQERASAFRQGWQKAAARLTAGLSRPSCRVLDEDERPIIAPVTLVDRVLAEAAIVATLGDGASAAATVEEVMQAGQRIARCDGTLVHFGVGQLVHDHGRRLAFWLIETGAVNDDDAVRLATSAAATAPTSSELREALARERSRMAGLLRSEPAFTEDAAMFDLDGTVALIEEHFAALDASIGARERGWIADARVRIDALAPPEQSREREAWGRLLSARGDPRRLSPGDLLLLQKMENPLGRILARSLLGGLTGVLSRMHDDALETEASIEVLSLGVQRVVLKSDVVPGRDPFGEVLRTDDHRVWSVGPDGEDDGGDLSADIVFVHRASLR